MGICRLSRRGFRYWSAAVGRFGSRIRFVRALLRISCACDRSWFSTATFNLGLGRCVLSRYDHQITPLEVSHLLTLVSDDMSEASSLLRIQHAADAMRRPFWRVFFFPWARLEPEVSGGLALQFFQDNVDRAREHWSETLVLVERIRSEACEYGFVVSLLDGLAERGFSEIWPQIQPGAIPTPVSKAATHLSEVTRKIAECNAWVLKTNTLLSLGRIDGASL